MQKPIWEKFAEFKVRHGLSNQKIAEIANRYAHTEHYCARTTFKANYGISEHVFYKVLDYAVIAQLVDKETQDLIFLKRISNNCQHGSEGAEKSVKHKNEVLQLQQEYAVAFQAHLASFTEVDLFKICKEFGRDGLTLSEIAKLHKTSSRVIKILLNKGLDVLSDTYHCARRKMEQ